MKKALSLCAVLALSSLSLAACGGDDDEPASTTATPATTTTDGGAAKGGNAETLALAADPSQLMFDQTSLSASAGKVTIDFDNPSAIGHDVVVEQNGSDLGKTDVISQSKTSLAVDLKAGDYTFYCSVDGHRQAGMEGTLTVK